MSLWEDVYLWFLQSLEVSIYRFLDILNYWTDQNIHQNGDIEHTKWKITLLTEIRVRLSNCQNEILTWFFNSNLEY